jgi:hypothetical protein
MFVEREREREIEIERDREIERERAYISKHFILAFLIIIMSLDSLPLQFSQLVHQEVGR